MTSQIQYCVRFAGLEPLIYITSNHDQSLEANVRPSRMQLIIFAPYAEAVTTKPTVIKSSKKDLNR